MIFLYKINVYRYKRHYSIFIINYNDIINYNYSLKKKTFIVFIYFFTEDNNIFYEM